MGYLVSQCKTEKLAASWQEIRFETSAAAIFILGWEGHLPRGQTDPSFAHAETAQSVGNKKPVLSLSKGRCPPVLILGAGGEYFHSFGAKMRIADPVAVILRGYIVLAQAMKGIFARHYGWQ